MQFPHPLLPGRFVERYKRFFADVVLDSGQTVTAHCPNPGSMTSCLHPGARVWLSESANPARRLRYTWEIVERGRTRIFVNPVRANSVVADALSKGRVAELARYHTIRREVRYGRQHRFDFLLAADDEECFVEVKNVTLGLGSGRSAFPDSVTERGRRHVEALARLARGPRRAVLLFCVARGDATTVEPADDIDPAYGRALRRAVRAGVEVLAYRCTISPRFVRLDRRLPVVL